MPPDPTPEFPAAWIDAVTVALHDIECGDRRCEPTAMGVYRHKAPRVLDALLAADALVTPPGRRAVAGDVEPCDYLSKACQHGFHDRCRLQCKFCPSVCRCLRHNDETATCGDPDA